MRFIPEIIQYQTYKMGSVEMSYGKCLVLMGEGQGGYDEVRNEWQGMLVFDSGEFIHVAAWYGTNTNKVNIWVSEKHYLIDFVKFLQGNKF